MIRLKILSPKARSFIIMPSGKKSNTCSRTVTATQAEVRMRLSMVYAVRRITGMAAGRDSWAMTWKL